MALILLIVTTITFFLLHAIPGDPITAMMESASGNIFQTLKKSTVSMICIRGLSASTIHRRNTGHTGAALSQLTAIWMRQSRFMGKSSNL